MKCPKCDSEKLIKGKVFNQVDYISPEAFFRPKELKPFSLFGIHARINKNDFLACTQCGHLWADVDPQKLVRVIKENCQSNTKKRLGID